MVMWAGKRFAIVGNGLLAQSWHKVGTKLAQMLAQSWHKFWHKVCWPTLAQSLAQLWCNIFDSAQTVWDKTCGPNAYILYTIRPKLFGTQRAAQTVWAELLPHSRHANPYSTVEPNRLGQVEQPQAMCADATLGATVDLNRLGPVVDTPSDSTCGPHCLQTVWANGLDPNRLDPNRLCPSRVAHTLGIYVWATQSPNRLG
jgi:hypothetical protein